MFVQKTKSSNNNSQDMSSLKIAGKGDSTSNHSTKDDSNSSTSSLSSDFMENASSSSSSSSFSYSNGPLYQLSDLMDQLPLKRGLSKCYQGKSQSFASLASVESLEDLAKRENPYNKRIKLCKSFCGGLNGQKFTSPKGNISKKASSYKGSYSSSALRRNCSHNFMATCRLAPIPLQKDF